MPGYQRYAPTFAFETSSHYDVGLYVDPGSDLRTIAVAPALGRAGVKSFDHFYAKPEGIATIPRLKSGQFYSGSVFHRSRNSSIRNSLSQTIIDFDHPEHGTIAGVWSDELIDPAPLKDYAYVHNVTLEQARLLFVGHRIRFFLDHVADASSVYLDFVDQSHC